LLRALARLGQRLFRRSDFVGGGFRFGARFVQRFTRFRELGPQRFRLWL
jgi:hypothetical protein